MRGLALPRIGRISNRTRSYSRVLILSWLRESAIGVPARLVSGGVIEISINIVISRKIT